MKAQQTLNQSQRLDILAGWIPTLIAFGAVAGLLLSVVAFLLGSAE
jgi:ABC-type multidrug transport system permease subunit